MFNKKFLAAGMTAATITAIAGISALASQGYTKQLGFTGSNANQYLAGQNLSEKNVDGVDALHQDMMDDSVNMDNKQDINKDGWNADKKQEDKKVSLGRKSDEEAMKEGNPTPELPEGVTVEDFPDTVNNTDKAKANTDLDANKKQVNKKVSLGRKSDEEAMKEGNPTPELPEGVTVEDFSNTANNTDKAKANTDLDANKKQDLNKADLNANKTADDAKAGLGTDKKLNGDKTALGKKTDGEATKKGKTAPKFLEEVNADHNQ